MIIDALRRLWRLEAEVLGMNARNLEYIYRLNPRPLFPRADDKVEASRLIARAGVPVPRCLVVFETRKDLERLEDIVEGLDGFAVKPVRGFGGRGVAILRRSPGGGFASMGQRGEIRFDVEAIREHILAILAGVYSLERLSDRAFLEELLEAEEVLGSMAYKGLPDIRVLVCEGRAAMAMVRLPTRVSGARANLHQGALGLGVDMDSGRTTYAVWRGRPVERHPDTGAPLASFQVPCWDDVLDFARRAAAAVGLGYLGVDVVIDKRRGPLVMEVNARPGLTIQLANRRGLARALREGGAQ